MSIFCLIYDQSCLGLVKKKGMMFFFTLDWGCVVILYRCKKYIHITNEDIDQTRTCVARGHER